MKEKKICLNQFFIWVRDQNKGDICDLKGITCDHMSDYMDHLFLKGLGAYTIKVYMANIKSFFGFLYKHDFIISDPTRKLPLIKVPKKEIVYIPHDEIMNVLDTMFTKFRKRAIFMITMRDFFIIRVAYATGWRASEAI